jgi:molecular chaperone DnaJ
MDAAAEWPGPSGRLTPNTARPLAASDRANWTMAEPRDYYELLGVPHGADNKAIKDAFRQLALKYHPDRNKEPCASKLFKEIAEAYAVLSDPKRRAEYDARGYAAVSDFSSEDTFSGINFDDIFGGFGFDFGRRTMFDRLFQHRTSARQGENVEITVTVPLDRVLTGGGQTVHLNRPATCQACKGSGAKVGTNPRTCDKCGGSGQFVQSRRGQGVTLRQITTCPDCAGSGIIIDRACPECRGIGQVVRNEAITVQIPVGIEDGMTLRAPGRGQPADKPGLPAGDLFVVIRTADDPHFERHGRDLYRIETVDVVDAVLGAEIEVSTLEGRIPARVDPGTQPDTVLRLRGKGLPQFGGGGRGDLYVSIHVHVPECLSDRQRRLFEQLRETADRKRKPSSV